jgi:putative ABC transport system substrate-binding protein
VWRFLIGSPALLTSLPGRVLPIALYCRFGRDTVRNIAAGVIPSKAEQMAVDIGRRQFISALGGALAVCPISARAQRVGRLPTIGFLGAGSPTTWKSYIAAFTGRLQNLGWIDGRTVALEIRWAEGQTERYPEIAAEFVRLPVDVIVTPGSAGAAVKKATSTIPIVLSLASDPVGSGLVESLDRPGGNVTGLSIQADELAGKRIELLHETVPNLQRIGILFNPVYSAAVLETEQVEAAAHTLGLNPVRLPLRSAKDIARAIDGIKGGGAALYGCIDGLVNTNQEQINNQAVAAGLPTLYGEKPFVESGGLLSYGPNIPALFSRAAEFVDKILKGANPANIPIEQPTKFELIINLKTAKALGLSVPPMLLTRADDVIE